ncbi:Eukaryotic translation initiation factor 3 subunit A [Neolecta irregularis DAH-3]|uniref:Eukaryotic translation initiation factor 3 subunit A n=1 Tax=Neolecta irregularis (strain DAH-3) TaxID=1198029 RepID=A0A1U7LNU3_NEOID|nr:Eukaryotic translation initiation factor 3 subunit A [Neolecta irregularis DAH-3]|eukprot:OLL24212.1 Eukaryotic translation initiation factor 3 subunit A [Neolecta irregularis DAH-3]
MHRNGIHRGSGAWDEVKSTFAKSPHTTFNRQKPQSRRYGPTQAGECNKELSAVGQQGAALEALHSALKKPRGAALSVVEPIALRFIELCTDLRKGKVAKEGLYDYRKLVVKTFLGQAEKKVMQAQAKADKLSVDKIEDLEATETPESIMLSLVSNEQSKDRTDRELVTPWLKFLWEAYRTVLETLKNNSRLEQIYQETAHQAFNFCLRYSRKAEFRRLCDLLRNHLGNVSKYTGQAHSINLSDADTLQRHLDTRFTQLNAAADLELWQEAYRSVEDHDGELLREAGEHLFGERELPVPCGGVEPVPQPDAKQDQRAARVPKDGVCGAAVCAGDPGSEHGAEQGACGRERRRQAQEQPAVGAAGDGQDAGAGGAAAGRAEQGAAEGGECGAAAAVCPGRDRVPPAEHLRESGAAGGEACAGRGSAAVHPAAAPGDPHAAAAAARAGVRQRAAGLCCAAGGAVWPDGDAD